MVWKYRQILRIPLTAQPLREIPSVAVDSIVVQQASWSDWIIAELQVQCNLVLPALIKRWSVARNGNHVDLHWSMLTEMNIRNYIVQHATDDLNFKDIAVIPASAAKTYFYTHENSGEGTHWEN